MAENQDSTLETVERLLEKMNVNTVFGPPIEKGDLTLIPVAECTAWFGHGSGRGGEESEGCQCGAGKENSSVLETVKEDTPNGGGSGGGGFGKIVPRGYVKIGPTGATFEPILNHTKIAVTLFTMIGWSTFWLSIAVIRALAKIRR